MSELTLVYEDEKSLYEKSDDYEIDENTVDLVKGMIETMMRHDGIGLAAPQVGINKRLFVIGHKDVDFVVCINPSWEPAEDSEFELFDEGCLSFPGLFLKVKRHNHIVATYTDIQGNTKTKEFNGVWAQAFQHEYEHLDGVTFDTKVGKTKLKMAQKKREKVND